jgi:RNA polymerase sigma-70 factor (ECF subfamily)
MDEDVLGNLVAAPNRLRAVGVGASGVVKVGKRFTTTQWSRVQQAKEGSDSEAREALEELCQIYWHPLYAFIRRQGSDPEAAQDLTQAYFTELLEKDLLQVVDPAAGRFRSFLLASLKHFISHERDKERAQKRGGGTPTFSLEADTAEMRLGDGPADELTPEQVFERQWALTVLERSLERLHQAALESDTATNFERLKPFLTGEQANAPYRELAAELGMTESAVSTAVHRLRKSFGVMLRAEVAETVADPADVDDEIRHLLGVIQPLQ